MATQPVSVRIGVPTVQLSVDDVSTNLPSLASLVFDASATTINAGAIYNDIRQPLSTSNTYQVMLAFLGRDLVYNGYTIGVASPGSGVISLSAGQGIKIHVSNTNWPGGFDEAIACAIFLKTNSANLWQLADYAFIDPSNDFNHMVAVQPLSSNPTFTAALLQSASSDASNILGSRAPIGVTYTTVGPTTNGVQVVRDVANVTVSPDDQPDYQVTTSRSSNIRFSTLPNNVNNVIQSVAGTFVAYTGDNSTTIQEGQMTLITAQAVLKGDRSIKFQMPPDALGVSETRVYIGNLTVTQAQITEDWQKLRTTPIQFDLQTAAQDSLLVGTSSELIYKRGV